MRSRFSAARHRNSRADRRVAAALVVAMVAVVALAGCGSRRDYEEFVAANTAGGVAVEQTDGGMVAAPGSAGGAAAASGAVPAGTSTARGSAGSATAPAVSAGKSPQGTAPRPDPAAGAAASGKSCAISGSTITIGNIATQSGFLGELFNGLPEALQVWVKAANACGGLGGHPVRLISADDGGDPAVALTLARRLVEKEGAIAFVGLANPLSVQGVASYLKDEGIPAIGGESSSTVYYTNPVFFPIGPHAAVIGGATADVAIKRGAKKLAVYYCIEVPNSCGPPGAAKDLAVGSPAIKRIGGEVVISQPASVAAPSYTSQCIAAKRAGVDGIIVILDGPSIGRFAGNCEAQDYHPKFIGISLGVSRTLPEYPQLNKDNFFAPSIVFPWMDRSLPATRAYSDAAIRYFGRPIVGPSPAMAWASGVLAQEATKGGLPANPTPADMLKAMYTVKNTNLGGLTSPLTFTTQLPRVMTSCYFVLGLSNKQYLAPEGAKCVPVDIRYP
ncbi:ABC transporter substrate-binding protein [Sporichthya polymorpha]|uniref:ABC transporter substrate-binding protein n=1 Tax=Sporichthya polymorpha TaxID=35751 RepID=UPI00039F8D34|nr:ABC transporter substrate-binding protein [Sporichthya polymorpha]